MICEELEITEELLELLIRKKVLSQSNKRKLQGITRRKERIMYLLKKLEKTRPTGYVSKVLFKKNIYPSMIVKEIRSPSIPPI